MHSPLVALALSALVGPSAPPGGRSGEGMFSVSTGQWPAPKPVAPAPAKPASISKPKTTFKPDRSRLQRLIDEMLALPTEPSLDEVVKLVSRQRFTSRDYTSLFKALRRGGRWKCAVLVGEHLIGERKANTIHLNALLSSVADAGDVGVAEDLLARMEAAGGRIEPDAKSFSAAIRACERSASADGASRMLETYEKTVLARAGADGAPYVYSAAMRALTAAGAWERAIACAERMRDNALELDAHCYSALLGACREGEQWRRAIDEHDGAAARGVPPSYVLTSLAMGACLRARKAQEALDLFERRPEELARRAESYCHSGALLACRALGKWERAIELVEELEGRRLEDGEGAPPTEAEAARDARLAAGRAEGGASRFCWEHAIGACEKAGQRELAKRMHEIYWDLYLKDQ